MKTYNEDTGVLNKQYRDNDLSKEARDSRWQEFQGLKRLPFWTKEQEARYCELFKLRKIDNEVALKHDYK